MDLARETPDTFFLLAISIKASMQSIYVGPYSDFLQASAIGMDSLPVVAYLNGMNPSDFGTAQILECTLHDGKLEIIAKRGVIE